MHLAGAQTAERGKFDLFFISDSLVMDPGDHPSFVSRFEPTTLIGALSAVTRRVGLGATISTSFSEPYDVARTIATLHHISGGRTAWNVVTSSHNVAALNFSMERLAEHVCATTSPTSSGERRADGEFRLAALSGAEGQRLVRVAHSSSFA